MDQQVYDFAKDLFENKIAEMPATFAEELASREFTPEVRRIVAVSGYVTPCTWSVQTDRGDARFVLKSEESIRRLSATSLLIGASQGIHFLVRDVAALDAASRKILDRFL